MALFMRINGEKYELEPGTTNAQRLKDTLHSAVTNQTAQNVFRWNVREGDSWVDFYIRPEAISSFAIWETPEG